MSATVTDIIAARSRQPEGLTTMVFWSVIAHACGIGLLLLAPGARIDNTPRTVMTISLGGAPGPQAGGLTQMGGREVPPPAPEQPIRREETPPPPPAQPAMTLPDPRKQAQPKPPRRQATEVSRQRPAAAEPPQQGSTRAETNARGQGFGLSSGGSGSRGVELDVANFCCPEYLEQMVTLIQRNWEPNQGVVGAATMKFTILRDGAIQAVMLERSSGFVALDVAANRAVMRTQRLPPLPSPFPNPTLTVHMRFEYQR